MNCNELSGIITDVCSSLELDLRGKKVLTEAANSYYSATACIPAFSGAQVYAYVSDNVYSTGEASANEVKRLADVMGIGGRIKFIDSLKEAELPPVDIITNSYSLRPLDEEFFGYVRGSSVVLLMYEEWEKREADIDYGFCQLKNIPVVPTDEHNGMFKVFDYTGHIVMKCLLENNVNVERSRIGLIGSGLFFDAVNRILSGSVAEIIPVNNESDYSGASRADVFVYCDYQNNFIPAWSELSCGSSEDRSVIQLVGVKDSYKIRDAGFKLKPEREIAYKHMAYTFDYLGPRPVVELTALSYKSGEEYMKARDN